MIVSPVFARKITIQSISFLNLAVFLVLEKGWYNPFDQTLQASYLKWKKWISKWHDIVIEFFVWNYSHLLAGN